MLQGLTLLDPIGAERDQIIKLATLRLPWSRDGNDGCLFDDVGTLLLTGKIARSEPGTSRNWCGRQSIWPTGRGRSYFFKNAENKSIGSGRKVVVLCSLAISRMVWR